MPDIEGVPYETTGTALDVATAQALATRHREVAAVGVGATNAAAEAKALSQSVVAEVGTIRTAVVQSANSATAAADSAAQAEQTATDLVPRMEHIETMAGLAPGEVTDAQTANLILQPDTQARAAVNAASVLAVTSAAERTVYVSARGSDTADGLTLRTAKATVKAALDSLGGPGLVQLPWGTVDAGGDLILRSGHTLRGAGVGLSTINYTGTGTALASASPDVRTYRQAISDVILNGPGKATSTVGMDLASFSEAAIDNVAVVSFGTGIRLRSSINGGAVYNRFYNVKAQNCTTGWDVQGSGSNGNVFTACRANACDLGIQITDSNNNTWLAPQIEACALGVRIHANSQSLADFNTFYAARFENNSTAWETTALVRYTSFTEVKPFGPYMYVDAGVATMHTGAMGAIPNYQTSTRSDADGSWRWTRTAHGSTEHPAFLVRDANAANGTPVTYQAETERATGYFYRGKRGGETYWDVDASGNMRAPKGGYIELTERSSDPAAPPPNMARIYLLDNGSGKTQLRVRFATGGVQLLAAEPQDLPD